MKMKAMATVLLGTLIVASTTAMAGTPLLDAREHNQKNRIVQGVKSGELTARETAKLLRGQRQLHRMERRAKADGVVTARERARLQHKADIESARIYKNTHDNQSL